MWNWSWTNLRYYPGIYLEELDKYDASTVDLTVDLRTGS
jgi:hypothetical protein